PARPHRPRLRPRDQRRHRHHERGRARPPAQLRGILRLGSLRGRLSVPRVRTKGVTRMNELIILLGWLGVFAPVGGGALGSAIGVAIAGQAAIGAMQETDSGYGRFIGAAAIPSSNVIYGIVVMFALQRVVTPANGGALFGIGF